MASEPKSARAVHAPRRGTNPRPPGSTCTAVGFGGLRSGAASGRWTAIGARSACCFDGTGSATSSAGLAAKGGGGDHDLRPRSVGKSSKSCRRQVSGAVHLGFRDGIRGGAAPGYHRRRAQWWKTNFGNWIKFAPPPPKCVAGGVAQSVTVSSVASNAGRNSSASSSVSAAAAAGGDSLSSGVDGSTHGRCTPVVGVNMGTVTPGFGVGSGIWAGVQAVVRVLRGAAAGVAQPVQAGHDLGASGAARAPVGQSLVAQNGVGSSAQSEKAAWAEEKAQFLLQVGELKRQVAGLYFELESKRARTRKENAQMKGALKKEHEAQVARLRSDARAAWDAGTAQAAELAQEQQTNSELSHELKLAHSEIVDLKKLLRSAVERAAKNPESSLSPKVAAVMDTSSVTKSELATQQHKMMAMTAKDKSHYDMMKKRAERFGLPFSVMGL